MAGKTARRNRWVQGRVFSLVRSCPPPFFLCGYDRRRCRCGGGFTNPGLHLFLRPEEPRPQRGEGPQKSNATPGRRQRRVHDVYQAQCSVGAIEPSGCVVRVAHQKRNRGRHQQPSAAYRGAIRRRWTGPWTRMISYCSPPTSSPTGCGRRSPTQPPRSSRTVVAFRSWSMRAPGRRATLPFHQDQTVRGRRPYPPLVIGPRALRPLPGRDRHLCRDSF